MSQDFDRNEPPSSPPPPPSGAGPTSPPPPASPPPGGGGAGAAGGGAPRLPWEERDRLGFVDAYVQTAKLVAQQPAEAFGRIRATGDYVAPLLFAGIIIMAATVVSVFLGIAWGILTGGGGGDVGAMAIAGGIGIGMAFLVILIAPIFIVIGIFLTAGIFHGILSLAGGLNASRSGFEGTFQMVCYASITSVLAIIPVIGSVLHLLAFGYLSYIGLPRVHGCNDRQALYALIPLMVCGGCAVIGMAVQTVMSFF